MIKSVFQKINFVIKAIIFYLLLLTVVCSFIYFLIYTFQEFLVSQFRYDVSKQSILHLLPFSYYLSGWAIFTLLYLFFTYDIRSFYRKVQNITLDSLSDRKLPDDFPLYKSTYTFEGISTHLHSILSLYKSFDNMKTARIMLEVNSVKQLMNVVDEGVLLINADRVVTHINHNGEQLLRLIPGEIIPEHGQIELNLGKEVKTVTVSNSGDRPVQVGSHYHFFEANKALIFDRELTLGMRLDIPAGTAIRFEPGDTTDVKLVPYTGLRIAHGFNSLVNGSLET